MVAYLLLEVRMWRVWAKKTDAGREDERLAMSLFDFVFRPSPGHWRCGTTLTSASSKESNGPRQRRRRIFITQERAFEEGFTSTKREGAVVTPSHAAIGIFQGLEREPLVHT
jgi:hypothetical protein